MLILSPGELQIRPNAQIVLWECCYAQANGQCSRNEGK